MRRLAFTLMLGMLLVTGAPLAQAAPEAPAASAGAAASAPVNLNTASAEELQALRGVGPKTAELIVRWREEEGPFQSVEQLLAIKGIGEKTLARLRDQITL
ncbi:helix-hairpin-helix domain-containing protein [Alcanivorax marinus]|nr:helix-hairpin-helix domain-containing protein [Alloalcanivorax marinus]